MNLFQAVNNAISISLATDERAGIITMTTGFIMQNA